MQVPPDPQTGSRRGDQLFDTSSSVHPVPALFALPRVLVGNSPGTYTYRGGGFRTRVLSVVRIIPIRRSARRAQPFLVLRCLAAWAPMSSQRASRATTPTSTGRLVSGHLSSDFDEQLFKPELYELESENDAQERPQESESCSRTAASALSHLVAGSAPGQEDMRLPGALGFIQSDWFLVLSGLVVAFNIMCLYIQVACDVTDEDAKVLENVNDTCLVLYTIEA
eukprot:s9005_g3.t1